MSTTVDGLKPTELPAPLEVGQSLEVEIEALTADGRALARVQNMVLFVAGALPQERVKVKVTALRRRYAEAELEESIVPSPDAVPAICPHKDCGGCPWQGLSMPVQHVWKERFVRDAFARIAGFTEQLPLKELLPSPLTSAYRNKMEFAFGFNAEGDMALGLRERGAHIIVEVTECFLQTPLSMQIVAWLRKAIRPMYDKLPVWDPKSRQGFWRYVVIRQNNAEETHVEIITARHPEGNNAQVAVGKELALGLRQAFPSIKGVALSERVAYEDVAYSESVRYRLGAQHLEEQIGQVMCTLGPMAFLQVNSKAAEQMYSHIVQTLQLEGVETVWDMYTGVGAIGLTLAPYAGQVFGVDSAGPAISHAKECARRMGFEHVRFYAGDAAKVAHRLSKPQVIVVDPPRAGLDEGMIKTVLRVRPKRLMYVSCNPATLARDAALLSESFSITSAQPVDMFPHSPHVEVLALFERKA